MQRRVHNTFMLTDYQVALQLKQLKLRERQEIYIHLRDVHELKL